MILKRMKIITRLLLGFLLLILSTLIMAGVAITSINQLSELTRDIFDHPFTVSTAILQLENDLRANQVRVLHMVPDREEQRRLLKQIAGYKADADKQLSLIRQRYLGPSADVDELEKAIAEWRAAREDTVNQLRSGKTREALAGIEERDDALAEKALKKADDIYAFATAKAASFKKKAETNRNNTVLTIVTVLLLLIGGGIIVALIITRSVAGSLRLALDAVHLLSQGSSEKVRVAEAISRGDLDNEVRLAATLKVEERHLPADEMGQLVKGIVDLSEVQATLDNSFQKMTESLRRARLLEQQREWLKNGQYELNRLMSGDQQTSVMAARVLSFLAEYIGAGVGALFIYDEQDDQLELASAYAYTPDTRQHLRPGEGLIGQSLQEGRIIRQTDLPIGYLPISSALGEATPRLVIAIPLKKDQHMVGALELGFLRELEPFEHDFLEQAKELIAIGFSINLARQEKNQLLVKTIEQTEELRVQQEELQQSNEELEERAQMLEQQRERLRASNQEVQRVSDEIRRKAAELERVSGYKSEFLANMSHELRTPLNSLMILSGLLKDNREGNLTPKQVEFAATINSAGADLLNLINDVLDLSKIEAGKMELLSEHVQVEELAGSLAMTFEPVAEQKGLTFRVEKDPGVPEGFLGDQQRVMQILKNLLSNAFKFTADGEVLLQVTCLPGEQSPLSVPTISFTVRDSGIGIAEENQARIFQAFKQADGTTSRKYGGTGLGLSISLELAQRMNGDIRLVSQPGHGSSFTLLLPLARVIVKSKPREPVPAESPLPAPFADDRKTLRAMDKSLLIIEDDPAFAATLLEMVRQRGFCGLVATDGNSGVTMAEQYQPNAILLDVLLPEMDGWWVMHTLKANPRTRHIPVHFLTCLEERQRALAMGAVGFLTKPIDNQQMDMILQTFESTLAKSVKHLLIVEDDPDEAKSLVALLDERDIEISVAATGKEAIELLSSRSFDSIVLDLGLSDMSGFDLLEHIRQMDELTRVPVIIHSGRELTHEQERELRRYAESIIIKGAKSPERLLNEVSLFLHLVESRLHPDKQRMIRSAVDKEALLERKKVLLVDDDMRNVFSLISLLSEKEMIVVEAENGREALTRLEEHPDVDIVLMDIMMPEMDGYAAINAIRKQPRFSELPVIAMTAKALKGDHEKCLASGASDYISKPIDAERLFSMLRVWLYQSR